MRTQLNKMKKSIGFNSEREIDERIDAIEFKLLTDSHTLKDEKKFLQEIQELKRNRPKVSQVHKMEEGLATFTEGLSMKDKVSKINEEMASYREQKKAVSAKLTELMEGRKEQLGDLPEIVNGRMSWPQFRERRVLCVFVFQWSCVIWGPQPSQVSFVYAMCRSMQ